MENWLGVLALVVMGAVLLAFTVPVLLMTISAVRGKNRMHLRTETDREGRMRQVARSDFSDISVVQDWHKPGESAGATVTKGATVIKRVEKDGGAQLADKFVIALGLLALVAVVGVLVALVRVFSGLGTN